jgi:hypothetical protein
MVVFRIEACVVVIIIYKRLFLLVRYGLNSLIQASRDIP